MILITQKSDLKISDNLNLSLIKNQIKTFKSIYRTVFHQNINYKSKNKIKITKNLWAKPILPLRDDLWRFRNYFPSFHSRLSCLVLRVLIYFLSFSLLNMYFLMGFKSCSLAVCFIYTAATFIVQSSWKWKKLCIQEENEKENKKIFFSNEGIFFKEQTRNERTEGISPKLTVNHSHSLSHSTTRIFYKV